MAINRILLIHAQVVLGSEVRKDVAVLVEEGVITAVDPCTSAQAEIVDLSGRLLIPGLIDLHCDAIEKEVEPRPGVHFPLDFACAQADRRNAAAGITTVFHAISFANHELGVRNNAFAAEIVRSVMAMRPHSLVDNRVHARYEITDETGLPILLRLMDAGMAQMVSFMDHTPGQGQFKDADSYRTYLARTYRKTKDEIDGILERKRSAAADALERMKGLANHAKLKGIPLASHDDDTPEKVGMMAAMGATISEFPVTLEAARASRSLGLSTLFGAPNVLRGRSQSGSVRAMDAVLDGCADCLCGDYSSAALLPAVMKLPDLTVLALPKAVAMATLNPARAAGLHDRGEIAVGKRADLVAVSFDSGSPQAETVWVQGVPVLRACPGRW